MVFYHLVYIFVDRGFGNFREIISLSNCCLPSRCIVRVRQSSFGFIFFAVGYIITTHYVRIGLSVFVFGAFDIWKQTWFNSFYPLLLTSILLNFLGILIVHSLKMISLVILYFIFCTSWLLDFTYAGLSYSQQNLFHYFMYSIYFIGW